MTQPRKPSRAQLLKMIDDLEKAPDDRMRIMGEAGITAVGAGLGAASAATIAGMAGATTVLGSTTLAGALPFVAATTPIGWVIGSAAVAAFTVFAIARAVRYGGMAEGTKRELLVQYQEREKEMAAKETAGATIESDRTQFIVSLRIIIEKDVIRPDQAFRLIEQVEAGRISIAQAYKMLQVIV